MKVLIPLAEGFEEIEFVTVVDILRRAGVDVIVAGLREGLIAGSHKIGMMPDTTLNKIKPEEFDAVVLPGGSPGFINLKNDERVLGILQDMNRSGKYVCAICAAPSVLIKAGVLEGRRATVSPSGREEMKECTEYVDERVVADGSLITSQSPGTAMEFALKLVEAFAGPEKMREIKGQTLAICKGD
jgi:4-methyl-5(b-hydroxyethyl)-thiazole monophosphate biosynthesis